MAGHWLWGIISSVQLPDAAFIAVMIATMCGFTNARLFVLSTYKSSEVAHPSTLALAAFSCLYIWRSAAQFTVAARSSTWAKALSFVTSTAPVATA